MSDCCGPEPLLTAIIRGGAQRRRAAARRNDGEEQGMKMSGPGGTFDEELARYQESLRRRAEGPVDMRQVQCSRLDVHSGHQWTHTDANSYWCFGLNEAEVAGLGGTGPERSAESSQRLGSLAGFRPAEVSAADTAAVAAGRTPARFEVQVLAQLAAALDQLDEDAQRRALVWLTSRAGYVLAVRDEVDR